MKNISFFARHYFLGNECPLFFNDTHIIRLSSQIRGEQIARYIGGKYNPTEGYENDLLIYIKPRNLDNVRKIDWLDFADGSYLLELLPKRPDIRIIVSSQTGYEYLKSILPNEIIYIPQQHLNWENQKRERKEITTCGYIGGPSPVAFRIYDEIRDKFKEIGFDFVTCYNFKSRQDAIDFYKQIDILILAGFDWRIGNQFTTPTKMINAASFGIPAVARRLIGYKEFEGNYVAVDSLGEMLAEAVKFKNKEYYGMWSDKIIKAAEEFHISKIAEKYKKLLID